MRASRLLILLVLALPVSAQEVNEVMKDAGDTMLRILPSLYSEAPDRTLLLENLVRLEYLFKLMEPHFSGDQEGAQVSYALLRSRLRDAVELGERRNINLMRSSVIEAFSLCSSCHTQDKRMKRAFGVSRIRELDEYLAGEFSFLTRDYESALVHFENYLEGESRTARRDEQAIERVLVIAAEVFASPAKAGARLHALGQDHLEGPLARRAENWSRTLARIGEEESSLQTPIGKPNANALTRFLDREWPALQASLGWDEQEAYWIVIRGELNRFLSTGAAEEDVPALLYWLAVSDRALHYRFYNSLSRGYLEQCIEKHPRHPYAERCLAEYETLVVVSFSGSGGVHVPREVRDRVSALRRLVHGVSPKQ